MERKETATSSDGSRNPIFAIEKATVPAGLAENLEEQKDENNRTAGRWTVDEHRKFIECILSKQ